jgi:putative ATP-dependent endonuclease of the OLD family
VKLTKVEVRNYRSFFADAEDERSSGFAIELADGMNALIGPNNVGKSNLLRAVALALDPSFPFDRSADVPGPVHHAYPAVTLTFECNPRNAMESTLLKHLEEYERQVARPGDRTYAQEEMVRYRVAFPGSARSGANRRESFEARGAGARKGDPASLAKPLEQFHKFLQFVLVSSGQSLEELLTGKFREILQTVIRDRERERLAIAVRRRSGYVEQLQDELLAPLRQSVIGAVRELFPEITGIALVPQVSSIDETLSNVAVNVTDAVETALVAKGTGVRGAVMVGMLRYLAEKTKRSIVFAVEEPESFLHPKAQEELRDDLENLAERSDVTLLVTTHSPFIVSRNEKAKVISLTKDARGRTIPVGEAGGAESHASLLGGLFRDAALADLLERAATIPAAAKGIVVVEGRTDEAYLRLAARVARRADLLDDLYVVPAGNAERVVIQSVLLKQQTDRPLLALLDNDEAGKHARDELTKRFKFQGHKVVTVDEVLPRIPRSFPAEAEDLFPNSLMERFVREEGRRSFSPPSIDGRMAPGTSTSPSTVRSCLFGSSGAPCVTSTSSAGSPCWS